MIAQYESFTYMNKTDDYYYDIENENESEIKTALYRFFQLEKYSELADKNYFGESPSKIEIEDISAISITENDYNQFVLNVFQKTNKGAYGLIIRAILIDYQQVVIEELENAATLQKQNYRITMLQLMLSKMIIKNIPMQVLKYLVLLKKKQKKS